MRLPITDVRAQICIWILVIDILLEAELNVTNDLPSPKRVISCYSRTSFYQTVQDNGPTGTIRLTQQEPLWLSLWGSPLCGVKEGTRSFTVTQTCKMSGMFKHVWVHRHSISMCSISCNLGLIKWFQMCCWEHRSCLYHRHGVRLPLHVWLCVCLSLSDCFTVAWALCQSFTELWSCSQLRPLTSQFEAEPTTDRRHLRHQWERRARLWREGCEVAQANQTNVRAIQDSAG